MLPRLLLAISVILCSACGFAVGVSTSTELAAALATSPNTVTLEADIDCSGWTTVDGFSGTLDGQRHKLLNLNAPLFGTITGDIAISNLVVKDAYVNVSATPASILLSNVAAANLAVENVTFTGSTLRNTQKSGNVAFVVGLFSVISPVVVDRPSVRSRTLVDGVIAPLPDEGAADAVVFVDQFPVVLEISGSVPHGMCILGEYIRLVGN